MKEGKGSFVVALWWLLGCFCLGVLLLLLAPREARMSESEKRLLAGAPVASRENVLSGEFFTDIEEYLCDGFFSREAVINATDDLIGVFDKRTEEQKLIQEEARINQQLTMDAQAAEEPEEQSAPEITTPEPTQAPTSAPTETPEPTPTLEPTPEPTAEPTPAPTETPAETHQPTAEPTPSVTPEATSTPTLQPTPEPTATPKVIIPLAEDAVYQFLLVRDEEKADEIYTYPAENITNFAASLNHLKEKLPEDGEIHYMQVPVAAVGVRVCGRNSQFIGWKSTMEDALQSQVREGIYIHNAPAILNDHLAAKEQDVYYFTDHHWTPKGAWYALEAVMQSRGYPVVGFEEYTYQRKLMDKTDNGREDWIMAMEPLLPVDSVVLTHLTEEKECPFMYYKSRDYVTYLYGTHTPWRRFISGYGTDRRALVICDSFGNVFVPYLLPYYDQVHMTDLRNSYYDVEEAGGTFSELLAYHEIDDIYIVFSTSNGINSANSQKVFWKSITE